jgi:hypothetical protein
MRLTLLSRCGTGEKIFFATSFVPEKYTVVSHTVKIWCGSMKTQRSEGQAQLSLEANRGFSGHPPASSKEQNTASA